MLRIRKIDPDKLRRTVTEKAWGHVIPMAVVVADTTPELALSSVIPVATKQLADIGITADISTTKSPPPPNPTHESAILIGIGAALGVVLAFVGQRVYHLTRKRS